MVPEHGIGLDLLSDALHHVTDNLQELHTSAALEEESCYFDPSYIMNHKPRFRRRKESASMKQLHTVTIPCITLLLGWDPADCDWEWKWNGIFPQSLRHITSTDQLSENCLHGSWTDQSLMPVISGIVSWLSAIQAAENATEVGLHLFKLQPACA